MFDHLLIDWQPFVSDQKLALIVGVSEHILCFLELSVLVNFGESIKFNIVHRMVLSKLNNDWVLHSIFPT